MTSRFENYNFTKELHVPAVETYWARRTAQYKALEAAYTQKDLNMSISIEVDKAVLSTSMQETERKGEKRKVDVVEKRRQKKRREEDEEEEETTTAEVSYVLDLMEINAVDIKSLKIHRAKKQMAVEERLLLSSIKMIDQERLPDYELQRGHLCPNPRTNKPRRNGHSQLAVNAFASVILQNAFAASLALAIDWDTLSFATKGRIPTTFKTDRPDVIIICCCGVEVGCGEVKPPGKGKALVDKNRARIAELCKRQLHARLKHATSAREQSTFGVLIAGMSLELTKLQFNNDNYFYSVLKSIELPRRSQWYSNIEAYFETLFSFKVLIEQSLGEEDNGNQLSIYDQCSGLLNPTARFLK
ncbi:hypothetical protein RMATCC62417_06699 [Rhizopus microsporus]|nr:hypothetical protein RMATCC62417_06699 [Rhizopus microsporus]